MNHFFFFHFLINLGKTISIPERVSQLDNKKTIFEQKSRHDKINIKLLLFKIESLKQIYI